MCSQTGQRTSYNTFHFLKIFSHALGCQMETFKFALTCGWNSLHPISSITSAKRPLRLYTCLCHPRGPKTPLWVRETTDRVRCTAAPSRTCMDCYDAELSQREKRRVNQPQPIFKLCNCVNVKGSL